MRWLERYRRKIATLVAATFTAFGFVALPVLLGADWPRFHARLMALVGGIVLALVIDIGLASVLAVWETRHDRLIRVRGLPRATLVRR